MKVRTAATKNVGGRLVDTFVMNVLNLHALQHGVVISFREVIYARREWNRGKLLSWCLNVLKYVCPTVLK